MCRICLKRPEIPDERYGRCEACAKSGRIAYRFRVGPARSGGLAIKAGELSPRALRQKWKDPLAAYNALPAVKPHLGLHEVELLTARGPRPAGGRACGAGSRGISRASDAGAARGGKPDRRLVVTLSR